MEKYKERRRFTYDVFLSFRGEDTRNIFIGHLHDHLLQKGIKTFIDDNNLKIGEGIFPAISKAIQESKISIIVFSENYASSTWCLAELDKIIKCTTKNNSSSSSNNDNKQLVFPIFYHVDPSDVRHQKNSYNEAMTAHANRFGENSEKVQAWRSALHEAANLKGHHISTGCENIHIKKIVGEVYANIAPKPLFGDDPVGLEHRIEELRTTLDMKPNDDTESMRSIYGISGIGKTEIAKALCKKIVHQFKAASFLVNVREESKKISGQEDRQKSTLPLEMLEVSEIELGGQSIGMYEKEQVCKEKVLLVLDDIDDVEQLKIMASERDWFPGSRIIITPRDEDLLIGHKVDNIYKFEELDDQHSLELFCQNVFGKIHPETGYEEGSSRAIGYSKGVPSELKVIGSDQANEKSLQAWECALEEYKWNTVGRIQDMLQRSLEIYTKTKLKLSVVGKRISKRLATAKDELSWKYQWHVQDKLLYVFENLHINI